jgi:hypothetical protein
LRVLGSFCQNLGSFGEFLGSFANYGFSSRRYQRIRDLVVEDTSAWKNQNTFAFLSLNRIRDLVVEDTSAWKNQNTFCFFSRLIVSL